MNELYPKIEDLLPHRLPILCIDKVDFVKELKVQTVYTIKKNSLFFDGELFSEMGLLENVAQTSFVFLKFFFAESKDDLWGNGKDSVGFISQINALNVYQIPRLSDQIFTQTETELIFDTENLKICNVSASTYLNSEIAFSADLKLILQTRTI